MCQCLLVEGAPLWPVYLRNGDPMSGSHIRAVPPVGVPMSSLVIRTNNYNVRCMYSNMYTVNHSQHIFHMQKNNPLWGVVTVDAVKIMI